MRILFIFAAVVSVLGTTEVLFICSYIKESVVVTKLSWSDVFWTVDDGVVNSTVENVRKGYTGNDVGVKIWTFSAALMFSLTVFTTIGKYLHA